MKNVLNLLLLHLSTHRERVLAGIKMLAEMNQLAGEEKPLQMDSEKQMVSWHCLYCATSGSGVGIASFPGLRTAFIACSTKSVEGLEYFIM